MPGVGGGGTRKRRPGRLCERGGAKGSGGSVEGAAPRRVGEARGGYAGARACTRPSPALLRRGPAGGGCPVSGVRRLEPRAGGRPGLWPTYPEPRGGSLRRPQEVWGQFWGCGRAPGYLRGVCRRVTGRGRARGGRVGGSGLAWSSWTTAERPRRHA